MVKDRLVELHDKQSGDAKPTKTSTTTRMMAITNKNPRYTRVDHVNDQQLAAFLEKCESSTKKLHELRSNVHNLSVIHDDIHASVNINDKKLLDKRHRILADIRSLTFEIRDEIRDLKNDVLAIPGARTEGTSGRMAALHLQKLTSDLNDATERCQSERARFDDRVKARMRREYEIIGEFKTDSELNELIERENFSTFTQVDEVNEARRMLDESQQRQYEVTNLEKSVIEVHELFIDINMLVKDQGEIISTIEGNVNSALKDVEGGQEQLKKADECRKKISTR